MTQTPDDQLDREIIPALFDVLPDAFPEFGFKKTPKGYKSTTDWKVTHERGDSTSAVSVTEEHPYYFKDWTRGGKAIYTYVKEREGLEKHYDVVRKLAELAGVTYREQHLSPEEEERFRWVNKQAELWEAANDFFIECLSLKSNQYANSERAKQVQDYLSKPLEQGGRGYNATLYRLPGQFQDNQRPRMELGFIPDIFALRDYLVDQRGFDSSDVTPLIRGLVEMPDNRIGVTNVLTFPYRDQIGRIKGMVFRSTQKNDQYKYLYSPGLKRSSILFNLKSIGRNADLVIVESPLDALHASALGIKNITALGGSGDTLNKTQIDLAIRYGANRITLMLDNDSQDGVDHAGAKGTDKAITFLQKDYPNLKVYVGQYPDGIKDLDELLIKQGEEGFYSVKDSALAAWRYQLFRLLAYYSSLEGYDKLIDDLNHAVIELGSKLNRIDNDSLIREYASNEGIKSLGVTEEGLKEVSEQIRKANQKKQQQESFQNLLREAKSTSDSKGLSEALDLLQKEARSIKAQDKADAFSGLSATITEEELKARIKSRPEPLESGFELDGEPLLIPSAAITMVAAATSHGKSIMIANLAINLADLYPKKTFHIFSYEVDEDQYLINLLNPFIGDNELAYGSNRDSIHAYLSGKTELKRRDLKDRSKIFTTPLWKNKDKQTLFNEKKAEFFKNLIGEGRIKVHYVMHDSDTLIDAIRHLNKTEPLGAILIDYIQLINLPVGKLKNASRQEQVKQMCQDFKDLFNETGLPLIFAAQFNRGIQGPFDMHPTNLGEAGDLERIASLVLAIWNNSQKWTLPTAKALEKLKDKIPFVFDSKSGEEIPDPKTWYVEAIKRRTGRVGAWDIWDYLPNAGKVMSHNHN